MRVLIVEDEADLVEILVQGLRAEGMAVDAALDGDRALEQLCANRYDVVVLDRDLPGPPGDEVCRQVVASDTSSRVLMLTAAGTISDRVEGLSIGADDYLPKPFAFAELVARIRALGRRTIPAAPPVLSRAGVTVDPGRRTAIRAGRRLDLGHKEFGVLEVLLGARGTVVSAEELLERVWDAHTDPFTSRTLVSDHSRDVQWHQARRHLHFRATRDLRPRVVGRGPGRRGRTVFGPHYARDDPGKVTYYHHAALIPRFRRIGGAWFCQLGVDYCFTRDGKNESSFADTLLTGIKRLDRHPAVRGWTTMWEAWLQGDLLTADSMLTFGSLLTFPVDHGIDEAWWGPAPAAIADEDTVDAPPDEDVEAVLCQAGIGQDDLLSFLEDEPPAPPKRSTRTRRSLATSARPGRRNSKRSSA